jgi:hypothetical protein
MTEKSEKEWRPWSLKVSSVTSFANDNELKPGELIVLGPDTFDANRVHVTYFAPIGSIPVFKEGTD